MDYWDIFWEKSIKASELTRKLIRQFFLKKKLKLIYQMLIFD